MGIVHVRPEEDQLTIRVVNEPYVVHYWAEFLLPRLSSEDALDPRDQVGGVAGLRYRREGSQICLHRPGMPARIMLTGFNPWWWQRIAGRLTADYDLLQSEPDWTPVERAAYAATAASSFEPASLFSPLLRRIRATAGPGSINSTDAWSSIGGNFRLETTDGPPCPDLIRLLGNGPTGLGWEVDDKSCTCLCDHTHTAVGCNIDFREPATGRFVYYSNTKWGRTLDDRRRQTVSEMNRAAFT